MHEIWVSLLIAVVLARSPALGAVQGPDVLGWETATWGMSEADVRAHFPSTPLISLPTERQSQTVLAAPGYIFLGCPFDVAFSFAPNRGLVRVELSQVEGLTGHFGRSALDYETACRLVGRHLDESYGRSVERGLERDWRFPSANVSFNADRANQIHVTFEARWGGERN
jgi:hypothetical protein